MKRLKALRIAIIAHLKHPISEPFAGGVEMHTYLLATKLAERGHDVTVFASASSDVCGAVSVCPATAAMSPHDAHLMEHRAYLRIIDVLQTDTFDIIHNNSLHYLPLQMAGLLNTPMLTTLHTPPFDPLGEAARIAAAGDHSFVGVSDTIAGQWSDHLTVRDVIPNGVDLSRFAFHAPPSHPAYAVWYGRIVPEKGLHLAIDAARMAGLPLRFAGPMLDGAYFNAFIAPRLGADISYEGHLNHVALSRLIGNAGVFLCTPCWEEPFGLVVTEALASGVPVAAFARGAIPKILDAASGALAIPNNAESLAQAARKALSLSRADCRSRAERICDAELMIDRYIGLYAEMAGQIPKLIPKLISRLVPSLDVRSLPLTSAASAT